MTAARLRETFNPFAGVAITVMVRASEIRNGVRAGQADTSDSENDSSNNLDPNVYKVCRHARTHSRTLSTWHTRNSHTRHIFGRLQVKKSRLIALVNWFHVASTVRGWAVAQ